MHAIEHALQLNTNQILTLQLLYKIIGCGSLMKDKQNSIERKKKKKNLNRQQKSPLTQ